MLNIDPDAFSDGQIGSKLWLCQHVEQLLKPKQPLVVWLFGGWYGTLSLLLLARQRLPIASVRSFDIDPSAEPVADRINNHWEIQQWMFKAHTADVNRLDYGAYGPPPQLVINTSCEHFGQMDWWSHIPSGTWVALQATDMDIPDHISRVHSIEEMTKRYQPLREILFAGSKEFRYPNLRFTRFMLIGVK